MTDEDSTLTSKSIAMAVFKPRKRPTKKRKRTNLDTTNQNDEQTAATNDEISSENKDIHLSTADLLLLKQAQTLRDRTRSTGLDVSLTAGSRSVIINSLDDGSGDDGINNNGFRKLDDVADELKTNFSIERSGNDIEERMSKFIEDGMRKKFGQQQPNHQSTTTVSLENDDDVNEQQTENEKRTGGDAVVDIYAVPDRLKMNERRFYDPSEGMPAAGLEETEIPSEERQKGQKHGNESSINSVNGTKIKKNVAVDMANTVREVKAKLPRDDKIPGNYSANFELHRHQWKSNFLASRAASSSSTGNVNNVNNVNNKNSKDDGRNQQRNEHQRASLPQKATRGGRGAGRDESSERRGNNGSGSHKRFAHSTDVNFAERFRKRWKH